MPDSILGPSVTMPFPGLRHFESSEAPIFCGRIQHIEALRNRLLDTRFVAVVGTSGSGKSSLIRAGLLPCMTNGYVDGITQWRTAIVRPGHAPIGNLVESLSGHGDGHANLQFSSVQRLTEDSRALERVVLDNDLGIDTGLAILVDQFEELFHYHETALRAREPSEAHQFVRLLLNAAAAQENIYVVITMRSEFLGDCTKFQGLAEAFNRSQYLLPRLTREEREHAIREPLQMFGVDVTDRLVQRLLNDSAAETAPESGHIDRGGGSDSLPLLQHALLQTYRAWKEAGDAKAPIDFSHYTKIGELADAINGQAEACWGKLGGDDNKWTERVFRCLTATELGRKIRRPTELSIMFDRVGATAESDRMAVLGVIDAFRRAQFLTPPGTDSRIDIVHECVIWKWRRLDKWVELEAESSKLYTQLVEDARFPRQTWTGKKLAWAAERKTQDRWNRQWGRQYSSGDDFEKVEAVLDRSRRATRVWNFLIVLAVISPCAFLYWRQEDALREYKHTAEIAKLRTDDAKLSAGQAELQLKLAAATERKEIYKAMKDILETGRQDGERQRNILDQQTLSVKDLARQANELMDQRFIQIERLRGELEAANRRADVAEAETALMKRQQDGELRVGPRQRGSAVNWPPNGEDKRITGEVAASPTDGLNYVWIGPGRFRMGCSLVRDGDDNTCETDERPPHEVSLTKGFWIGQTEVTQAAYRRLMATNPSITLGDKLPVSNLSWVEAKSYCEAAGMRLPTEVEWEFAARAGTTTSIPGPPTSVSWFAGNSSDRPHQVGSKSPNPWGLFDMVGNVWEWTADYYTAVYSPESSVDPASPSAGTVKVLRGGAWDTSLAGLRISVRHAGRESERRRTAGVRCAAN